LDAVPRLQRSRLVVQAGVDDAAVVAALVRREMVLRLQDCQRAVRLLAQRVRRGDTDDPAADDDNVVAAISHTAGSARSELRHEADAGGREARRASPQVPRARAAAQGTRRIRGARAPRTASERGSRPPLPTSSYAAATSIRRPEGSGSRAPRTSA